MATFTRGFTGRGGLERDPRLPPGQYDAGQSWPVLTAEPTPHLDTGSWSFTVEGLVQTPTTWSWEEIRALPSSGFTGDIHCVTSWSKLGISFTGVSVDTLLEAAMPLAAATHVLAYSHTGYTTNLPLPDVTGGRAWVVWEVDGQPLPREHGGPARLARSPPVLLEERQVDCRVEAARSRRARLLGDSRVSQLRRSLARTEVRR